MLIMAKSKKSSKMRNLEALIEILIECYFSLVLITFVHALPSANDQLAWKASNYNDAEYPSEDSSDIDQLDQQFPTYPYLNTNFIPPLVHSYVLENATTNSPIARLKANHTFSFPSSERSLDNIILQDNQYQNEYILLNHQNFFAINRDSGDIFAKQKLINHTYVLDVGYRVVTNSILNQPVHLNLTLSQHQTKVPVLIEVLDINDNEPEPVKNLLSCMVYDNIDIHTPICTASFKDADRGQNSELTYSISFDDENETETPSIKIDPKTGSIYRRYPNVTFGPSELSGIITATDHGIPYLETSISLKITILNSNSSIKRSFNEKPYILDKNLKSNIILTGNEEPGTSISNLTPLDPDGDIPVMHIVNGDPDALFAIDDGSLVVAKNINFSEKNQFNLTLMISDGATKSYENFTIYSPKIIKSMPNRFNISSISVSSKNSFAQEQSTLTDLTKYALEAGYSKFRLYSASSDVAVSAFMIGESTGLVQLARNITYRFNGRHKLMFSIEDSRLPRDYYRSFVELTVNVILTPPPPPPTTTTTTTTTTSTTTTTTTTSTTTTTTTTTTTPAPTTITTAPTQPSSTATTFFVKPTPSSTTLRPIVHHMHPTTSIQYSNPVIHQQAPPQQPYDQFNPNYPIWTDNKPYMPPVPYLPPQSQPPLLPPPPPSHPIVPYKMPTLPPATVPTFSNESHMYVKTLSRIVIAIMAGLFLCACTCLVCRCCCRSPRKRYRENGSSLLNRSSFHSQQRLHTGHGHSVNGSMPRNINSRLSLRTPSHAASSSAKAMHSKYSAGDSVSLSAMNERSNKHKTNLIAPPSPMGNHSGIITHCEDDELYVNAFGPGHPQYLNELRRLKPDYTRMSTRLTGSRKPSSSTNVSSLRPSDSRHQSRSSVALPSTPVRSSSHLNSHHHKTEQNSNQKPSSGRSAHNRSTDLNGSRTTNTSNVSPSFNDNNSRTALLSSDDVRTPIRQHASHSRHKPRTRHVHTDSTAEYDDVASQSTVDDTTPQTSSENASLSEVPFDARFKTFVKQKKHKEQSNPIELVNNSNNNNSTNTSNNNISNINNNNNNNSSTPVTTLERYDKQLPPAPADSEDNNSDHDDLNDSRPNGRPKQNQTHSADNEEESEDSADEEDENAEEGVYDLGTSNLFLD